MKGVISYLLEKLLFTPNGTCPVCGKVLFSEDHYFCAYCFDRLPSQMPFRCECCGRPMNREGICRHCLKVGANGQDGGIVWLDYRDGACQMIVQMKFKHRQGLCRYVGKMLGQVLSLEPWIRDIDGLVPVPLHQARLKERGYNQSLLMAEGIAESLSEACHITIPVTESLMRIIDTPHQVGQGRQGRLTNLNAAFEAAGHGDISGKCLLLVDDVLTTGATLRACVDVLRDAGAKQVYTAAAAGVAELKS